MNPQLENGEGAMTELTMICGACQEPVTGREGFIGVNHADRRRAEADSNTDVIWRVRHYACAPRDLDIYGINPRRAPHLAGPRALDLASDGQAVDRPHRLGRPAGGNLQGRRPAHRSERLMVADICICGAVATEVMRMHYRRPRETVEPMAHDPWYVHGSSPIRTCGEVACEVETVLVFLATYPGADRHFGDDFWIDALVDDDPDGAA